MSKVCKKCGNLLKDTSKFCSKCGTPYVDEPAGPTVTPQPQVQSPVIQPVQPSAPVAESSGNKGTLFKIVKWAVIAVIAVIVLAMFFGDDTKPKNAGNGTINSSDTKGSNVATQTAASAEDTLRIFHEAITNKQYQTAYNLLGPGMQNYVGGYDNFVNGYSTTISSTIKDMRVISSDSAHTVIEYMLEAKDQLTTGVSTQHFKGKANLQIINGSWKIVEVSAKKVEAGSNAASASSVPDITAGAIASAIHSSADNEDGFVHSATMAIDGDTKTCWVEGVKGYGFGEWIQINFRGTYKVSGFNIWPGHQKSISLFGRNATPIGLRVLGSDGSDNVYTFDAAMGMQHVVFRKPIYVNNIKFVIDKVVPGKMYEDTCISEISFF